jgi:hypothetical protein
MRHSAGPLTMAPLHEFVAYRFESLESPKKSSYGAKPSLRLTC